jgi:hypothetical protein
MDKDDYIIGMTETMLQDASDVLTLLKMLQLNKGSKLRKVAALVAMKMLEYELFEEPFPELDAKDKAGLEALFKVAVDYRKASNEQHLKDCPDCRAAEAEARKGIH